MISLPSSRSASHQRPQHAHVTTRAHGTEGIVGGALLMKVATTATLNNNSSSSSSSSSSCCLHPQRHLCSTLASSHRTCLQAAPRLSSHTRRHSRASLSSASKTALSARRQTSRGGQMCCMRATCGGWSGRTRCGHQRRQRNARRHRALHTWRSRPHASA